MIRHVRKLILQTGQPSREMAQDIAQLFITLIIHGSKPLLTNIVVESKILSSTTSRLQARSVGGGIFFTNFWHDLHFKGFPIENLES
jgi:hypothetical protein